MNNSKDELKKSLDDRAKNLYQRIIQSNLATPERVKGCSETEITQIEQAYNELSLPYSYKVFLRHFGRGVGHLATDLEFVYPNVLSLTQYERDVNKGAQEMAREEGTVFTEELLPPNAFIFAMKYRMQSWYFLSEKGVEDPPIFYDLGEGDAARKVHESIFDFWETEVEYAEKLIAQSREREKQRQKKKKNS